uniref:AMP-dependent synthetase/ligase domain-containing protein n=1 Tax=Timema bartmani TaxID=61472 RepID=A0A7R9I3L9_9NEOP|nr:unnamed protein product [Timema bartmani]
MGVRGVSQPTDLPRTPMISKISFMRPPTFQEKLRPTGPTFTATSNNSAINDVIVIDNYGSSTGSGERLDIHSLVYMEPYSSSKVEPFEAMRKHPSAGMPLRQMTEVAAPSFDGSNGDVEAGLVSREVGGEEGLVQHGPDPVLVPRLALGRYLLQKLQLHGDKDFLCPQILDCTDGDPLCTLYLQIHAVTGERWTYSDVLRKSTSVAESLRALGLMTGEVVGMFTGNCMEFFLPILGAYYLGASIATFSPTSTVSKCHRQGRTTNRALNIKLQFLH